MEEIKKQHKIFAEEYLKSGDKRAAYWAAYPLASYQTAASGAVRLLKNASVLRYLERRTQEKAEGRIASMKEVKEFWTKVLLDETEDIKNRMKVSEYLAKTNAAFVDKVDADVNSAIEVELSGSMRSWAE